LGRLNKIKGRHKFFLNTVGSASVNNGLLLYWSHLEGVYGTRFPNIPFVQVVKLAVLYCWFPVTSEDLIANFHYSPGFLMKATTIGARGKSL